MELGLAYVADDFALFVSHLENGVDPNEAVWRHSSAMSCPDVRYLRELMKFGADIDARSPRGHSCLYYTPNREIAIARIHAGADLFVKTWVSRPSHQNTCYDIGPAREERCGLIRRVIACENMCENVGRMIAEMLV